MSCLWKAGTDEDHLSDSDAGCLLSENSSVMRRRGMGCCWLHFFSHSSDVLIDNERIHDTASHSACVHAETRTDDEKKK